MSSKSGTITITIAHADEDNTVVNVEERTLSTDELIAIRDHIAHIRVSATKSVHEAAGLYKLWLMADAMMRSIEEDES